MTPLSPTAKTLLAALPQTPKRVSVVPEVIVFQALPSQVTMVPFSPTAKALPAPLDQTSHRWLLVPEVIVFQALPS